MFIFTDLSKQIDEDAKDYLEKVKTLSPEKRVDRLNKINSAFAKSREFGDDKVQLAMQTYEMVSWLVVTKQDSNSMYHSCSQTRALIAWVHTITTPQTYPDACRCLPMHAAVRTNMHSEGACSVSVEPEFVNFRELDKL